jgi:hypothetical protein
LDRALGKREYARLAVLFGGEGAASLATCGRAAGLISVLLTVYPLKQGIEKSHPRMQNARNTVSDIGTSPGLARICSPDKERIGAQRLKSPERFVRNS